MNFRPKPICFSNKPPFFLTAVASLPSSHKKREKKTAGESAVVIYAHRGALILVTVGGGVGR